MEQVHAIDPNLAIAGLRIEVEKSLRKIAHAHAIPNRGALKQLVRTLGSRGLLTPSTVAGLEELVDMGNSAVHGATVDPEAAEWALRNSGIIIQSLNRIAGDPE